MCLYLFSGPSTPFSFIFSPSLNNWTLITSLRLSHSSRLWCHSPCTLPLLSCPPSLALCAFVAKAFKSFHVPRLPATAFHSLENTDPYPHPTEVGAKVGPRVRAQQHARHTQASSSSTQSTDRDAVPAHFNSRHARRQAEAGSPPPQAMLRQPAPPSPTACSGHPLQLPPPNPADMVSRPLAGLPRRLASSRALRAQQRRGARRAGCCRRPGCPTPRNHRSSNAERAASGLHQPSSRCSLWRPRRRWRVRCAGNPLRAPGSVPTEADSAAGQSRHAGEACWRGDCSADGLWAIAS